MKLYLRCSDEIDDPDVLFDARIIVNIDMSEIDEINASDNIDRFPGKLNFRDDIAKLLTDEYHFQIISEDDGEDGSVSNRIDSESVYFNTYYDLTNAEEALLRSGVTKIRLPSHGKVNCFIHFRISGHPLENVGYVDYNNFLRNNVKKHTDGHPEINFKEKEVDIEVSRRRLYLFYNKALEDIRSELDGRIVGWVNKARKEFPKLFE